MHCLVLVEHQVQQEPKGHQGMTVQTEMTEQQDHKVYREVMGQME
jgi:hypothetical protein